MEMDETTEELPEIIEDIMKGIPINVEITDTEILSYIKVTNPGVYQEAEAKIIIAHQAKELERLKNG